MNIRKNYHPGNNSNRVFKTSFLKFLTRKNFEIDFKSPKFRQTRESSVTIFESFDLAHSDLKTSLSIFCELNLTFLAIKLFNAVLRSVGCGYWI